MDPKRLLRRALTIIEREIEQIDLVSKEAALPTETADKICAYTRVLAGIVNKDITPDESASRLSADELERKYQEILQSAFKLTTPSPN